LGLALAAPRMLPPAYLHSVGTPELLYFAAQYPARPFPCQRFAGAVAVAAA